MPKGSGKLQFTKVQVELLIESVSSHEHTYLIATKSSKMDCLQSCQNWMCLAFDFFDVVLRFFVINFLIEENAT